MNTAENKADTLEQGHSWGDRQQASEQPDECQLTSCDDGPEGEAWRPAREGRVGRHCQVRGAASGSVLWPFPADPAQPSPFAVLEFSYEGLFLEAYGLLPVDAGNESSVL